MSTTPEPWEGGLLISGPGGTLIARVLTSTKFGDAKFEDRKAPPIQIADANAKLLKAAPKLAKALKDLLETDSTSRDARP